MPIITSHLTSILSLSLSLSMHTQYSFFFFSSFYIFPRHSLTLFVTSRSPTRARISHTLSLSFSLSAIVTHVLPLVSSYRLTLFLSLSLCVPFLRVSRSIHLCLERHATSRANRRERRMSSILLLVFNLLFVFFPPLLRTTRVFTWFETWLVFAKQFVWHDSNYRIGMLDRDGRTWMDAFGWA